jgi:hypothetical protein
MPDPEHFAEKLNQMFGKLSQILAFIAYARELDIFSHCSRPAFGMLPGDHKGLLFHEGLHAPWVLRFGIDPLPGSSGCAQTFAALRASSPVDCAYQRFGCQVAPMLVAPTSILYASRASREPCPYRIQGVFQYASNRKAAIHQHK